jgi:hypothetical protein
MVPMVAPIYKKESMAGKKLAVRLQASSTVGCD